MNWLTSTEVSDRMAEVYAVRVLDALRGDVTPAVRAHDGRRLLGGKEQMPDGSTEPSSTPSRRADYRV